MCNHRLETQVNTSFNILLFRAVDSDWPFSLETDYPSKTDNSSWTDNPS